MRTSVPNHVLKKDDEVFGPPGNRKPGVIEYETKMGLPDGRVFMDTMTNDQLLHLIAEGLEQALPGIMSKLPESAQKADTKFGMRLLEESRRNDFLHQYPDGEQRRKRTLRPLEKKKPLRPEENVPLKPYYTVHPKPAACEKCRAMADRIFPALPMIPHPNCRCEMREHIGNEWRVVEGRPWVNLKKLRNSGFPEGTMYADAENDTPADFVEMRKKGLPKGNREWTTFFEQVQDNALDQGASTVQAIESQIPGFAAKKRELEIISKREACEMTPRNSDQDAKNN